MAYEKRVCVLKQIKKGFSADGGMLSGAVYAERLGEELTITPRILGLAPLTGGRYALAVTLCNQSFVLELRGSESLKIEKAPSLKEGFAALLCYVRGEAEAIAFGTCGSCTSSVQELLAAFSPKESKEKKKRAPASPPAEPAPQKHINEEEENVPINRYDDEAIATSDYYSAADAYEQADGAACAKKEAAGDGACQDDAASHPFLNAEGTLTYYNSVRDRLDEAFEKFPADERLKGVFPYSRWVKGEDALLGIIYRDGIPKYLCVAVESNRELPAEIREHCVFVPRDHFTQDEGFYVIFQDADTGAYVKVEES